jgi:cell division protein FtsQ
VAREKKAAARPFRWRMWLRLGFWTLLLVSVGMAARQVHQFTLVNPNFRLPEAVPDRDTPEFSITGLRYAARERIVRVFERDFGQSVFAVPLEERRRRLLGIDWVEDAAISRLWPNRLRISVRERTPVAFVSLTERRASSRIQLIDGAGVILSRPPRAPFSFPVLNGIGETEEERGRARKVAWFREVEAALASLDLKASEVELSSLETLKITVPVDGQAVELILGDGNYAARAGNFKKHYPEIRKRSPDATVFDLRLDDRIIVKE